MADTSGQAEIRGLDINKLAIAYEEEASIFKKYCAVSPTSAREIRWYRKASGILSSPDTTAITASQMSNVAFGARPVVVEQSWTRLTSYVRKYFVESPWISQEDINDSDVDILAQNLRDLVLGIVYDMDKRIYNVATENYNPSAINTYAADADWDTASYTNVNIVEDIMEGLQNIRVNSGFDPLKYGVKLFLTSKDHRSMMNWLIDAKGSSIPSFASAKLQTGVVMEILGCGVEITENVTADKALMLLPNLAVAWKSFTPITTAIITEEGIGKKIRVWEEGEALLLRPKCVNLITNTQT